MNFDTTISLLIANTYRNTIFDIVSIFFSIFFSIPFFIFIVILLNFVHFFKKKRFSSIISTLLTYSIVVSILKFIVKRQRPYFIPMKPIYLANFYSFPSGHAGTAFIFAVFFSDRYPKYSIIFYLIAIIISLSRVYLGVHYLSDVITGAIIGFIISKIIIKNEEKINKTLTQLINHSL